MLLFKKCKTNGKPFSHTIVQKFALIYIRYKIKENSAISMPTMTKTTLFLQFFAIFLFHIIESFNFVTIHITIIIFYRQ